MISTESRVVRPFIGVGDIARTFDCVELKFGSEVCHPGSSIHTQLDPHAFLLTPVQIEWAEDEKTFEEFKANLKSVAARLDLLPDQIDLMVIATNPRLKISEIIYREPLTSVGSMDRVFNFTSGTRPRAFCAPHSGFTVWTYLVLNQAVEKEALRPTRKGTWLARARFRINTIFVSIIDPPVPLTDELRTQYSLESNTMRYLYFGDHDVLLPSDGQESCQFFVDKELLTFLNARPNSKKSQMLQLQLAFDYMSSVIWKAHGALNASQDLSHDVDDSLLGKVLRMVVGPGFDKPNVPDTWVNQVKVHPELVISKIEHEIGILKASRDVVKEETL